MQVLARIETGKGAKGGVGREAFFNGIPSVSLSHIETNSNHGQKRNLTGEDVLALNYIDTIMQ